MMLANPFTKGLRDRWMGMAIAMFSVGAMVWFAGLVYRDLDDEISDFFAEMPDVVAQMLGLVDGAGAVALVLSEMIGFIAPLTLAGLAISIGTGAIARQERRGTFELLLSNPVSRTKVLLEAAASTGFLVVMGGVVLLGTVTGAIGLLGVGPTSLDVGAAVIHLTALSLFFGLLALGAGAWTGNAAVASGSASGLLVLSWLAASLLPLVESVAGLARLSPWYYFASATPLLGGTDWGHVAVLLGFAALCVGLGIVGINRRDLRSGWSGGTLRDRLASNKRLESVVRRLTGNGHPVGSIFTKTLGDARLMASVTGLILAWMALMMGVIYTALDDVLIRMGGAFPKEMLQVLGIEDFTTVYGFLNAELFSITGPIALIYVAAVMGGRSIAGEQDTGSMDLLLANPIGRTRILLAKAGATATVIVALAIVLGFFTWVGTAVTGISLVANGLVGVTVHLAALGLVFAGLTFLLGALSGRGRVATAGTAGVAVLTYVVNGFLAVNERFTVWTKATPWRYYLDANPLEHGMLVADVGVLLGSAALLFGLAVIAFERADIRQ